MAIALLVGDIVVLKGHTTKMVVKEIIPQRHESGSPLPGAIPMVMVAWLDANLQIATWMASQECFLHESRIKPEAA